MAILAWGVGHWALALYVLLTLLSMCLIQAAVTIVTSSIAIYFFALTLPAEYLPHIPAIFVLIAAVLILYVGQYRLLDRMMKVIIIILTLTTLAALALVLFSLPAQQAANLSPLFNLADYSELIFLAAFLGWMPAPMDISVWHSVWSEEANRSSGKRLAMDKAMLDFKVGFFGTALLAMAFLTLGALLMFGSGETPSANGAVFASQLIKLYTDALGEWAYPLIGIAALATMFSTTLTCLDAYPRTLEESYFIWRGQSGYGTRAGTSSRLYRTLLVVAVLGTIGIFLIVKNHAGAMGLVVTTATVVSFISAPLIAYINFRVMRGNTLPEADRPNRLMQIWSWLGILLMAVFSVAYIGLIMR